MLDAEPISPETEPEFEGSPQPVEVGPESPETNQSPDIKTEPKLLSAVSPTVRERNGSEIEVKTTVVETNIDNEKIDSNNPKSPKDKRSSDRERSDGTVHQKSHIRSPNSMEERSDVSKTIDKTPPHHSRRRPEHSRSPPKSPPHSRERRPPAMDESKRGRIKRKRSRSKSPNRGQYSMGRTPSPPPIPDMRRQVPYGDYRPHRSKSPSVSGRHRKSSPTPAMRSWGDVPRRRSRSRTPSMSGHFQKSPKHRRSGRRSRERTPPQPHGPKSRDRMTPPPRERSKYLPRERSRSPFRSRYSRSPRSPPPRHRSRDRDRTPPPRNRDYRSRSRSPTQKRMRSPMRSRSSRSPRDEFGRNRPSNSSSVMLDNNKYSSTSFAAELMKQKGFKKRPQSGTPTDGANSSTSTPTAQSAPFAPSNQIEETDGSFHPHNGFMIPRSSTLPPLPLPVITKSSSSPMKAQSRLPMPPQCGTAISQLPLPSTSPVMDMEDDDTLQTNSLHKTHSRPKIIGKTQLPQQQPQLDPRCVDVFNIISQIGEGTYGQVYKAKDTDNT